MLRQKRTTVGLLTCARSASSRIGCRAKAWGSVSTSLATRCSAGASEVKEAVMRSSMSARGRGAQQCNRVCTPQRTVALRNNGGMNQLNALKQFPTVVAAPGAFKQPAQFPPQDATTHQSLILKALHPPENAPL